MRLYPAVITDPTYEEPKTYNRYQRFLLKHINDKRDLPFIQLLAVIQLFIIPVAVILYTPLLQGWWWWIVGIIYFYFSQFYFKGSFGLMLHCFCHRKLFKTYPKSLTRYMNWVICPLFGHLGDSYHIHHMGMHHVENNMPDDASSTMGYQRDSGKHFLSYWLRFMFMGFHDTFLYLFSKKRKKMYRQLTVSEVGYPIIVAALCFVNLKATLLVFIVPFVFARFVMMLGNWAQHAFVDPHDPDNDLASTFICLNTNYNHKCWNDGYHAVHHLRPGAHYTDMPVIFKQLIPDIVKNKTIVFENIHYLHIFVWLMTKRYDKLANHMVNIDGTFANEEEAIALLKARTKRFDLENFALA